MNKKKAALKAASWDRFKRLSADGVDHVFQSFLIFYTFKFQLDAPVTLQGARRHAGRE